MPRGVYDRTAPEAVEQVAGSINQPEAIPALASRPTRADDTRRERRRREDGDLDRMAGLKLAIPRDIQEQADREGKTLRWVLDTPGRMQQMIADDWDKVPDVTSIAADRESGDQLVLCSKYKDWYDADQAQAAKTLDERDASLTRGDKVSPDDKRQPGTSYTPVGNRISRQRGA